MASRKFHTHLLSISCLNVFFAHSLVYKGKSFLEVRATVTSRVSVDQMMWVNSLLIEYLLKPISEAYLITALNVCICIKGGEE